MVDRTHVDFDVTIYQASADGFMYSIRARAGQVKDVGPDRVFCPQVYSRFIEYDDGEQKARWVSDGKGYVRANIKVHDLPSAYVDLNRTWRFFDFMATYGQVKAVDALSDDTKSLYGYSPEFPDDERERAFRTNQLFYIMLQLVKRYTRQACTMYTVPDNIGAISSRSQPLPGWSLNQDLDASKLLKRENFFMMGWLGHNLSAEIQKLEDHKLYMSKEDFDSEDYRYNKATYDWPITQSDYTQTTGYAECHAALPRGIREGCCDYAWPMLMLRSKDFKDSEGNIDWDMLYEDGNDNGWHYAEVDGKLIPYWGKRTDGVVSHETYL